MMHNDLDPDRTVFWTYGGRVVHLRPRCRGPAESSKQRSSTARKAPVGREVCKWCTGVAKLNGSEGRLASSLPPDETVFVRGRGNRVHTDPSCHVLANDSGTEIRAGEAREDLEICRYCDGEAEPPLVSVQEVAALSPEDLGLSPVGERAD